MKFLPSKSANSGFIAYLRLLAVSLIGCCSLALGAAPKNTPQSSQPASDSSVTGSINCGLWRTDAGFVSTIQLKNRLVTAPIAVTPSLFMADGTEYDFPAVNLPASGIATITVNSLLASAPAAIASHISTFGSATLRYSGLQTALMAQMAVGSTAISESYMARFTSVMPGSSSMQTLEGLWWARDPGIDGFIALSNAAAQTRNVTVQAVTAAGQVQPAQSFTLAPHTSQMVDLISLLGRQPSGGEAGGIRIQFTGLLGEVNVVGGLENRQEGYSAMIPFWQAPMAGMGASSAPVTVAHPGVMVGTADPMMGFPAGTRFTPYLALRNLTANAEQVNVTLYTEQGTALSTPVQSLQPFESRQVDVNSVLKQLGLKDFNGSLTLTVSHSGGVSDVMSAAGSVDAKGTYVFEVDGRAAEQRLSKQAPYWSVKDGNDTMVSLWNSNGSPEDVMVTLKYTGGPGVYHFRVHLAPYATANVDVKELIANQSADADGNMLPANVQEGSLVFHSAKGVHEPLAIDVNVGIFNVIKGTCYYGSVYCDGYYSTLLISPSSFNVAAGGQVQVIAEGQYSDGTTPQVGASWSSGNTSVATVSMSDGYVTGVSPGQATITASATLPAAGEYSGYNPSCYELQPSYTYTGQAPVTVSCPVPIGETTSFSTWADNDPNFNDSPAIAEWIQVLTPAGNYSNGTITESNFAQAADGCYFDGSPYPETSGVAGSTWYVGTGGQWGPDGVGYPNYAEFVYYQTTRVQRGMAMPCNVQVFQQLTYKCSSGASTAYDQAVLQVTISGTGLTVSREGQSVARTLYGN